MSHSRKNFQWNFKDICVAFGRFGKESIQFIRTVKFSQFFWDLDAEIGLLQGQTCHCCTGCWTYPLLFDIIVRMCTSLKGRSSWMTFLKSPARRDNLGFTLRSDFVLLGTFTKIACLKYFFCVPIVNIAEWWVWVCFYQMPIWDWVELLKPSPHHQTNTVEEVVRDRQQICICTFYN